ncbi:MAG: branched-chain amino acid ABC transporter permease [Candidatus Dadabacteria bacterium]|nr:MAG: branched-chain amino acid ABC transporter permease [Candidatus Dadabacteria bacterium]
MEILPQLLVNSLISGSIYALASAGLALVYGLLRVLNFAHGHFMMVGAYAFYFLAVEQAYGLPASAAFALLVIVLLAALSFKIFVEPFASLSFFLPFVTTLSLATIFESSVSIIFDVNVKSLTSGFEINSLSFAGIFITPVQIVIILSALVLLGLIAFIIHSTSLGRRIRALSQDDYAGQALGVSKKKINYLVFISGAVLAAYAGILIGYETNLQPTMGNAYTIKAFAAMILGGLGNLWGTIAGAYVLGLVENLSIGIDFWGYSLPAGYKDAFAFVMILLVLLFKPRGLFNKEAREA